MKNYDGRTLYPLYSFCNINYRDYHFFVPPKKAKIDRVIRDFLAFYVQPAKIGGKIAR